jgi:GT2 family glycosyltransferase
MKLLVVILNYRVTGLTIDCLRTLAPRIGRVPGARVAVLENGTSPEAVAELRRAIDENGWGGWVDLSAVQPNRGFTGGNNIVVREALASADPPEYVLLLNADTLVRDGALEALVDFMDAHPRAGIAGSQLLSPDGVIQASPFRFPRLAGQLARGLQVGVVERLLRRWAPVPPTPSAACPVEWVSGASAILRRTMLDQIGLLDEGLYTYFDDVDLCLRARRAGWETWYVPESQIVHLEGAATGVTRTGAKRRPAYWFQARRRFMLKSYGPVYCAALDATYITGLALRRGRQWVLRTTDDDPPHLLADTIQHSVFGAGFRLSEVENPAMPKGGGAGPAGT